MNLGFNKKESEVKVQKEAQTNEKKKSNIEIVNYSVVVNQHYNPECDFYKILNIDENEDVNVIGEKVQIAMIAINEHIENGDDYLVKTYNDISNAWNVLRDPDLREAYNKERSLYFNTHDSSKQQVKVVENVEVPEVVYIEAKKEKVNLKHEVLKALTALAVGAAITMLCTGCGSEKIISDTQVTENDDLENNQANENVAEASTEVSNEEVTNEEVTEEVNVNAFVDPYNDDQVMARANAIHEVLVASNVNDVSVEALADQIRFINGSYVAKNEMDAYLTANSVLETLAEYGTAVSQAVNFAGGVVDENGVHQALKLSAFCLDNSEHSEFMNEASVLFVNVLTADTEETKRNASIQFLKQQADLQLGLIYDEQTNSQLHYFDLDNNEGFMYGVMSHISSRVIKASLGEKYFIPYTGNLDQKVELGINQVFNYYNPQCANGFETENAWYQFYTELVAYSTLNRLSAEEDVTLNK